MKTFALLLCHQHLKTRFYLRNYLEETYYPYKNCDTYNKYLFHWFVNVIIFNFRL